MGEMKCHNRQNDNESCVCATVRFIDQLQKEVEIEETCLNCSKETLGNSIEESLNTRPFSLFLPNGDPFKAFLGCNSEKTRFFRVEHVSDNCCATLRCLRMIPEVTKDKKNLQETCATFEATDFCCTVDLNSCLGIQCFNDTKI